MWGWVIWWQNTVKLAQISNRASFVQQSCGQSKPSVCDTSEQNKPVELYNQLQRVSAFVHVGVGIVCAFVFFILPCMCASLHKADKEQELQQERVRYVSQRPTTISWAYVRPICQIHSVQTGRKKPSKRCGEWDVTGTAARPVGGVMYSSTFSAIKIDSKGREKLMRGTDDTEETWGECVRKCDMSWDFCSAGENCPWKQGREKIKKRITLRLTGAAVPVFFLDWISWQQLNFHAHSDNQSKITPHIYKQKLHFYGFMLISMMLVPQTQLSWELSMLQYSMEEIALKSTGNAARTVSESTAWF